MKKISFDSSGEEKNRILEMHQKSTGRQYLNLINESEIEEEDKKPMGLWGKVGIVLGGAALIAGGVQAYRWEGGDAQQSVKLLHNSCDTSKLGNPLQPNGEHEKIAKELGDALRRKTLLIFGDTDNEGIKSSLLKIKSIPDYCKVASEYESIYGEDLYDGFVGDFSKFSTTNWDTYIRQPLTNAIKTTEKANNDGSTEGGGGNEGDNGSDNKGNKNGDEEGTKTSDGDTIEYKSCSGTYKLGCKDVDNNVVWQLQGCLGIKQTGKFGPNTESSLKEKTGNTSIDEREVWTLCKNEIPGEIALY
jgi:hypothetical protein